MTIESHNIEYKQSWKDDLLKWICAFANAQGGQLFIGVDDNGSILGLSNAKKLSEDLPNKIRDHLGLVPTINVLRKDELDYLQINVAPSSVPISLRGSYYFRSGSVTQELKASALTEFLLRKTGTTWDRVIEPNANLEDIDEATIEQFKKDAAKAGRLPDLSLLSVSEVLQKLSPH